MVDVDELKRGGPDRRDGLGSRLGWLTLIALAFLSGMGVTRIWLMPIRDTSIGERGPQAPTAVPATPVPIATPTATTPEFEDTLPTLYIEIAPDNLATLAAKREEALETWVLLTDSNDFVPATVRLGTGAPVPVRLRLKGDWGDHFAHEKWSYRIEVRGENGILGMRVFSIQDPSTRTYLNEWLFLRNLRAEEVMGVGYDFVQVVQNGEAMGIYAVEEGFSKELIESQNRREGVIIRYNEDLLWEHWSAFENDLVTPRGVQQFYTIDEFDTGRIEGDPALRAQRDVAVGKLRAWWAGELPSSDVFDVEATAKYWALVDLWGAQHALQWHNQRFYYNPVTTLLEPIGFDAQPLGEANPVDVTTLPGLRQLHDRGDPQLQRAYARHLWRYAQPQYLAGLEAQFADELARHQAALDAEFGNQAMPDGRDVLASPWDQLSERQASLRELLSPLQMTYAHWVGSVSSDTVALTVGNLLDLPVEIVGLQAGDVWLPAGADWRVHETKEGVVDPVTADSRLVLEPQHPEATFMAYVPLEVAGAGRGWSEEEPAHLVTRIWGLTQTITQPVLAAYAPITVGPVPEPPLLAAVLTQHPYLQESDEYEAMLTVAPGTVAVRGDLVLPTGYGLRLEAGTTLRFGSENALFARGPLVFEGQETAPVVLEPTGERWRGVVVLGAGAPSIWRHVTVRATDFISRTGWALTGGITFYESPLHLSHSRIAGTYAEDALNTIRTRFEIIDSEFSDTASDAFDGDFCQGVVLRSIFHDIGADAIDVSGSEIEVRDVRLIRLGDKGLSVGESSRLVGQGISVEGADFGVASKDLSSVEVESLVLTDIRLAALAAYIKKPVYGPASMTVAGLTLNGTPPEHVTLIQTGSWIDLEGERFWGTDIDVEALYEKW